MDKIAKFKDAAFKIREVIADKTHDYTDSEEVITQFVAKEDQKEFHAFILECVSKKDFFWLKESA